MHAEKVGIQTEKLENLRISIARGSPMWETLELCIDVVDSHSLELLVPRLAQMVKSGIGLNTRYFGKYLNCPYHTSGLENPIALNFL